jgi:hypothetical protein
MRKIIFRHIIDEATLPRESAALFDCSYYDIIVKLMIKLIERDARITGEEAQTRFLIESARGAFSHWLIAEPNLTSEVKPA